MKTAKVRTKELNVNDLCQILAKHFKAKSAFITISDAGSMFKHKNVDIGISGILTLTVELIK